MRSINLMHGTNQVLLSAHYTTNNFGEQSLTFVRETLEGSKYYTDIILNEGEHVFDRKSLIELYNNATGYRLTEIKFK